MSSDKATTRKNINFVVGLNLATARVKKHLCSNGINTEQQTQLNAIEPQLLGLKKSGAPERPTNRPDRLPKGLTAEESLVAKTERARLVKEYDDAMAAYDRYASDNYVMLKTAFKVYENLSKVHELMTRKRPVKDGVESPMPPSMVKELERERERFSADIKSRAKENAEEFERRKEFRSKVLAELGPVNLEDVDALDKAMKTLVKTYTGMDLLIRKADITSKRVRVNESAIVAVSAVVEASLKELILHACNAVLNDKMKKITPDHCVTPGVEDGALSSLYLNLPHFVNVRERADRRALYEINKSADDETKTQQAREYYERHRKKGSRFVRPASTYLTFGEQEVRSGYAVALPLAPMKEGAKSAPKQKFQWKGIDIEPTDSSVYDSHRFDNYINALVASVKETDRHRLDPVSVSKEFKRFFNNLAIDLIQKFAPVLKSLIEYHGTSTVMKDTVVLATKLMLFSGQSVSSGFDKVDEVYDSLFGSIDKSVNLLTAHRETVRDKAATNRAAAVAAATTAAASVNEASGEAVPVSTATSATRSVAPPVIKGKEVRRPTPAAKK